MIMHGELERSGVEMLDLSQGTNPVCTSSDWQKPWKSWITIADVPAKHALQSQYNLFCFLWLLLIALLHVWIQLQWTQYATVCIYFQFSNEYTTFRENDNSMPLSSLYLVLHKWTQYASALCFDSAAVDTVSHRSAFTFSYVTSTPLHCFYSHS